MSLVVMTIYVRQSRKNYWYTATLTFRIMTCLNFYLLCCRQSTMPPHRLIPPPYRLKIHSMPLYGKSTKQYIGNKVRTSIVVYRASHPLCTREHLIIGKSHPALFSMIQNDYAIQETEFKIKRYLRCRVFWRGIVRIRFFSIR